MGDMDGQLGLGRTRGEPDARTVPEAGPPAELSVPSEGGTRRDCGVGYCGVDICDHNVSPGLGGRGSALFLASSGGVQGPSEGQRQGTACRRANTPVLQPGRMPC